MKVTTNVSVHKFRKFDSNKANTATFTETSELQVSQYLVARQIPFHYEILVQGKWERGSSWDLGEQGNIGKISKGKREHEPIFREQGNKTLQIQGRKHY